MTAETVVVHFYTLRDAAAFERAVRLLVARVRLTAYPGVRSFRFLGAGPGERRLVAIYEGPEAWASHHDLIKTWPEMMSLQAAARLARVDLLGPLTSPMQAWIDRVGLSGKLRHLGAAMGLAGR